MHRFDHIYWKMHTRIKEGNANSETKFSTLWLMNAFKSRPEHGMTLGISGQTVPQCNNNTRGTKTSTSGRHQVRMRHAWKKRRTYCLTTRSTRRDRNTKATALQWHTLTSHDDHSARNAMMTTRIFILLVSSAQCVHIVFCLLLCYGHNLSSKIYHTFCDNDFNISTGNYAVCVFMSNNYFN